MNDIGAKADNTGEAKRPRDKLHTPKSSAAAAEELSVNALEDRHAQTAKLQDGEGKGVEQLTKLSRIKTQTTKATELSNVEKGLNYTEADHKAREEADRKAREEVDRKDFGSELISTNVYIS